MAATPTGETAPNLRQTWLSLMARASAAELQAMADTVGVPAIVRVLRAPEAGLVMMRGRMGGSGKAFNMGEVTVTRCSVLTTQGVTGHGYVQGHDKGRARTVAQLDAQLQTLAEADARVAIAPLVAAAEARRRQIAAETAPTRVDFFTMVRGDD